MKKLYLLGLAGLLAAGIASCTKDYDSPESQPLDKDQTFFANIAISGTETMTRAGVIGDYEGEGYDPTDEPNFDEGTSDTWIDENKVSTIYLVFYDKDGKRVSTTQVLKDNNYPGRTDNENRFYSGTVQIDVKHGSLKPAYVMAFINPITATNFEINPDFATLDQVDKTTRPRLIDDNGNFAMSKSVYYGTDPVRNIPNERITATPFLEGQLFTSRDAAEKALEDDSDNPGNRENSPIVDIYVERYAAKVNFEIASGANTTIEIKDEQKNKTFTLKFEPEYWAVNAYESDTYITKSFFSGLDDAGEPTGLLSYDDLTAAFGGSDEDKWYWNSELNHRCYWAQSPSYYTSYYPRVADDIIDNSSSYGNAGGFSLGYYSYEDMKKNADKSRIAKARNLNDSQDKTHAIYARENTVAGKALQEAATQMEASPKAAIASVVLVGHYTLNGKTITENNFFYVNGNATNGYKFYENYDEMLEYFVNTTIKFSTDGSELNTFFDYATGKFKDNYTQYKSFFKIEHPSQLVRDGLLIDSRFVTIQIDADKLSDDGSDNLWALYDGEYHKVTKDNAVKVNQQMLYAAGTVQAFNGGLAYFTIPIKHLGFYRKGNKNEGKNANDKDFNWSEVKSGDFGLVRNHSYRIIVDGINGLGNAIPDPEDPIVPPTDPEEYFIGARIIVLNWAVVPSQHVIL